MSNRLKALALACALTLISPVFAVDPGLQIGSPSISGSTVTVPVHNASSGAQSARVQVTVALADGTQVVLTSSAFTLGAGNSTSITLTASMSVSEIEDDPEPIGISE